MHGFARRRLRRISWKPVWGQVLACGRSGRDDGVHQSNAECGNGACFGWFSIEGHINLPLLLWKGWSKVFRLGRSTAPLVAPQCAHSLAAAQKGVAPSDRRLESTTGQCNTLICPRRATQRHRQFLPAVRFGRWDERPPFGRLPPRCQTDRAASQYPLRPD